ncbi:surface carbohydrate biosynthesis protein [Cytobacillus firmus]|uniref:surface carbohydrate biosynthesis protein n=1 Tax=Cytobacillus firmus TaxID=1399 RepID=UPI0018CD4CF0|nr:surface carbohydrate biosynthesis protein [Cytobacillus firmus]MBG9588621.1 hypothetical protein [Cytobacillus firmus]
MEKKYLYFPIESKTRELDAKLLLSYYAIKNNYSVIIGEHTPIFHHLKILPKGIILSKGHPDGDTRKWHMANAKKFGYSLVELDEEALIIGPTYNRLGKDDSYINILDQIYCWGKIPKEMIAQRFGSFKNKLYITGHPRFDLLKKKFLPLYSEEMQKIKKEYGDFILVNTRFTHYNHFQNGFNPNAKFMKSNFDHFIILIKELSKNFPNLNIVVRPHIHESLEPYKNEFSHYKNVFVVHEGSVGKWIQASKVIIHNSCTTGIEALLLEKPVISYLPVNYELESKSLPNMVTPKAANILQIINFIKYSHSNNKIGEYKKILAKYYGAMDDNYAYKNIIDLLNKIDVTEESSIMESTIKAFSIKNGIDTLTSVEEIKNFFTKLDKIENTKTNIIIRRIAPDLFEIKS